MPRNVEETDDDLRLPPDAIAGTSGARRHRVLVHAYRAGDEALGEHDRWRLTEKSLMIGRRPGPDGVELHDSRASREHAELVYDRDRDVYRVVDKESRNGTFVDGLKIEKKILDHGSVIRVGTSLFVFVDTIVPGGLEMPDIRSDVAAMRAVAEATADLAAPTELTVLINGPTGAGKEILARRIHYTSRRKGDFVAVNCATLSKELIGSELFGHTAGAFSGAVKVRSGLFVSADGGTLLLDEIAELPLDQQASLLRVLQEKKVRPIGSDQEVAVDVRVLAATHQSLEKMEQEGRFRADLHARLAGFVIELPGLMERKEEILPLFRSFLGAPGKRISREAAEALLLYTWPHNVRELKHAAERARILAQATEEIDVAQLPPPVQRATRSSNLDTLDERNPLNLKGEELNAAFKDVDVIPREDLVRLLEEHQGNIAKICRVSGKHRQQIYRWLKKYGLSLDTYRPADSAGEDESKD